MGVLPDIRGAMLPAERDRRPFIPSLAATFDGVSSDGTSSNSTAVMWTNIGHDLLPGWEPLRRQQIHKFAPRSRSTGGTATVYEDSQLPGHDDPSCWSATNLSSSLDCSSQRSNARPRLAQSPASFARVASATRLLPVTLKSVLKRATARTRVDDLVRPSAVVPSLQGGIPAGQLRTPPSSLDLNQNEAPAHRRRVSMESNKRNQNGQPDLTSQISARVLRQLASRQAADIISKSAPAVNTDYEDMCPPGAIPARPVSPARRPAGKPIIESAPRRTCPARLQSTLAAGDMDAREDLKRRSRSAGPRQLRATRTLSEGGVGHPTAVGVVGAA